MVLVRSALDGHHDRAAADVTELAATVTGDDFYFFECIHVRLIAHAVVDGVIHVHTIEQKIIRLLAVAIHLRTRTGAHETGRSVHRVRAGGNGAGHQLRQRNGIASIQHHVGQIAAGDCVARGRRFRLQNRCDVGYFDGDTRVADLQADIQAGDLVDFELERSDDRPLKALVFHRDGVVTDRKEENVVDARLVGGGGELYVCAGIGGGHFRVGNDSSTGVCYGTCNGPGNGLCGSGQGERR